MYIGVVESPQHIQMGLQRILDHHLGNIAIAAKASMRSIGFGKRNYEIVNAIELAFDTSGH